MRTTPLHAGSFLPRLLRRYREFAFSSGRNPERDWYTLLLSFVALAVFLIAANFYLYTEIEGGKIFLVAPSSGPSVDGVPRELLDEVIGTYEARREKEAELLRAPLEIADPAR